MFKNLYNKKNLLAFSAGTDSSYLFYLLEKNNIEFDLIMVDYNIREQSKKEVEYAKSLNKLLHLKSVTIENKSNFEKKARDIRYEFFDNIMQRDGYDNLILGHNLSDKLEWLLMQLTKGAGIKELSGMNSISNRKNYTIVRPLLSFSKTEIMEELNQNKIKYFYDKSNDEEKYTRNYFRHNFSEPLIKKYKTGILKTFDILKKEVALLPSGKLIDMQKKYLVYEIDYSMASSLLSKILKKEGYLLSGSQREEFEDKEEITVIIENIKYTGSYRNGKLYFSPFLDNIGMSKDFKEDMRKKGIPPKHRGYLFAQLK